LWAVYEKMMPSAIIVVDTSANGLDWSAQLHFANIQPTQIQILPPSFPIPPLPLNATSTNVPLDFIVGDIRIIRDATECKLV
jgi:hypothetical protein